MPSTEHRKRPSYDQFEGHHRKKPHPSGRRHNTELDTTEASKPLPPAPAMFVPSAYPMMYPSPYMAPFYPPTMPAVAQAACSCSKCHVPLSPEDLLCSACRDKGRGRRQRSPTSSDEENRRVQRRPRKESDAESRPRPDSRPSQVRHYVPPTPDIHFVPASSS